MRVNKLLITDQPITNEQKWAVIAGVPYPLSLQPPFPLFLPHNPLPHNPLHAQASNLSL